MNELVFDWHERRIARLEEEILDKEEEIRRCHNVINADKTCGPEPMLGRADEWWIQHAIAQEELGSRGKIWIDENVVQDAIVIRARARSRRELQELVWRLEMTFGLMRKKMERGDL